MRIEKPQRAVCRISRGLDSRNVGVIKKVDGAEVHCLLNQAFSRAFHVHVLGVVKRGAATDVSASPDRIRKLFFTAGDHFSLCIQLQNTSPLRHIHPLLPVKPVVQTTLDETLVSI